MFTFVECTGLVVFKYALLASWLCSCLHTLAGRGYAGMFYFSVLAMAVFVAAACVVA